MTDKIQQLPPFIRSYGELLSHLQSEFDPLNSNERGDYFLEFAERIVPHTEVGARFGLPKKRQKTHDKGVDLECETPDKSELLSIQSKYTISGVDDLDLIISKFEAYETAHAIQSAPPQSLFTFGNDNNSQAMQFMIVTASDLRTILAKYEKSKRPSISFYEKLVSQGRLHIIDGPKFLPILQQTYRKAHFLPSDIKINLAKDFIHMGNVYIGVIAGTELKALYNEYGDAIFLENIREFLGRTSGKVITGESRVTVNEAIADTLQNAPGQFLARNNGITFRARVVTEQDTKTLKLEDASIVNGCQTTMSIVQNPQDNSYVLVKIVEAENSWDIAKAANFQNEVRQIDLDLARYVRPQVVRDAASKVGIRFDNQIGELSAFSLLDAIYRNHVTYEMIRSLFIGFFSRTPNNAIEANYTELRTDIIEEFYKRDPSGENTFDILFGIHQAVEKAAEKIQKSFQGKDYVPLFKRFWNDDKPNYRAFLAILAACGCVRNNIYAKKGSATFEEISFFLDAVSTVIATDPNLFVKYFRYSFLAVALDLMKPDIDRTVILQGMYRTTKESKFDNLYGRLCLLIDNQETMAE
jgi:hypothetical protein